VTHGVVPSAPEQKENISDRVSSRSEGKTLSLAAFAGVLPTLGLAGQAVEGSHGGTNQSRAQCGGAERRYPERDRVMVRVIGAGRTAGQRDCDGHVVLVTDAEANVVTRCLTASLLALVARLTRPRAAGSTKQLRAVPVPLKRTRNAVEATDRIIHSERDIGIVARAVTGVVSPGSRFRRRLLAQRPAHVRHSLCQEHRLTKTIDLSWRAGLPGSTAAAPETRYYAQGLVDIGDASGHLRRARIELSWIYRGRAHDAIFEDYFGRCGCGR
jgi:hypothetical protein